MGGETTRRRGSVRLRLTAPPAYALTSPNGLHAHQRCRASPWRGRTTRTRADGTDGTDETDGTDGTDETDRTDGTGDTDRMGDTDGTGENQLKKCCSCCQ